MGKDKDYEDELECVTLAEFYRWTCPYCDSVFDTEDNSNRIETCEDCGREVKIL